MTDQRRIRLTSGECEFIAECIRGRARELHGEARQAALTLAQRLERHERGNPNFLDPGGHPGPGRPRLQ